MSRTRIAAFGDSTTRGAGAGTGASNLTGAYTKGYPAKLAAYLNSYLPSRYNSTWGAYSTTESRVTLGSGWTTGGGASLGGNSYTNSTTTANWSYAASEAADTFDIYYIAFTGFGTFTVNLDGGATLATVNSAATSGLGKVTVTGAVGLHTVNIARNGTGGAVSIVGVDAYDSTSPKVDVLNWGYYGAESSNLASTSGGWAPLNAIGVYAPDLILLNIAINDEQNGRSLSSYIANVQAIITKAKLNSDIVLIAHHPLNTANASLATQQGFISAMYALAQQNSIPLIDLFQRWVSPSAFIGLGMNYDGVHPSEAAYADTAAFIASLLGAP